MAFTDIVSITAPSSAVAGERVDVTVKIKNIDTLFDHMVACVAIADGTRFIDQAVNIRSLQTYSFMGNFTMPSKNVTIYAYSYYPSGQDWILDDSMTKNVGLEESWVPLGSVTTLSLTPGIVPEEGWVPLGSITTLSLIPGIVPEEGWVPLGSITTLSLIPAQAWVLLGSITSLAVIPLLASGWINLGQLSNFFLTPPGIEPPDECSVDTDCPEGYICVDGVCVEAEAGFPWGVALIAAGGIVALAAAAMPKGKKSPKPKETVTPKKSLR